MVSHSTPSPSGESTNYTGGAADTGSSNKSSGGLTVWAEAECSVREARRLNYGGPPNAHANLHLGPRGVCKMKRSVGKDFSPVELYIFRYSYLNGKWCPLENLVFSEILA